MRQSAFAQDDCKTGAEAWERIRRVQSLRKAMAPRPLPIVISHPAPAVAMVAPPPPVVEAPPPLVVGVFPGVGQIPMLTVIKAACQHFNLAASELISSDRRQRTVFARHVCIYVAIEATQLSINEIARRTGSGDHTTIMYARDRIAGLLKAGDTRTIDAVDAITAALKKAYPDAAPPLDRQRVFPPDASKPNQGEQYSDEELALIKRRWTVDGADARTIAAELGRSKHAIARKLEHLGLCQAHKPLMTVTCANPGCGKAFQQRAGRHVYCSSKCTDRARKQRKREGKAS